MQELWTFTPFVDQSLIKPWMSKLLTYNMDCVPHPDVTLENQTGFFPFKLRLINSNRHYLKDIEILTGFEFRVEDFDISSLKHSIENKKSMLSKFFSSKSKIIINESIDKILEKCKKKIVIDFSTTDSFELRMACYSSFILAEITEGISADPSDNIWYNDSLSRQKCMAEIEEYESSFTEKTVRFTRFEGWP